MGFEGANNLTFNSQNENVELVKSMLCGAFYPNIARVCYLLEKRGTTPSGRVKRRKVLGLITPDGSRVMIHPSSVNYASRKVKGNHSRW